MNGACSNKKKQKFNKEMEKTILNVISAKLKLKFTIHMSLPSTEQIFYLLKCLVRVL